MKIGHFGTFDVKNYGDLLFPLILERRLAPLGAEIVHFSPVGGPPVWKDCLPTVPAGEIFESGKDFDALIVGGGDIIQSVIASSQVYGRRSLRAAFAYPSLWIGAAQTAIEQGIPLCWNAPGVPCAMPAEHQRMLRWATRPVDYLSVRNRASRSRLLEAGVKNQIELIPDTALEVSNLWTEGELADAHASIWQRLGRSPPARTVIVHVNPGMVQEAEQEIVRCIELIGRRWQAIPVLVPLCRWSGDEVIQRGLAAAQFGEAIVESKPESLREIAALFAHAEGYFGSSLHGMITASAFGKKGLLIGPKQPKYEGFLEWFDLEHWAVRGWRAAAEVADDLLAMPLDPWTGIRKLAGRFLDEHWKRVGEIIRSDGTGKQSLREQFPGSSCAMELQAYLPLVPEALRQEDQEPGNLKQNQWLQVFANTGNGWNETDSVLQQIGRGRAMLRFAHVERLPTAGCLSLRIDPVDMPAILRISNIRLVRDTDRVEIYAAESGEDWAKLTFSDGLLARVDEHGLLLISPGPDPQIYLPSFGQLGEEACTLEISLKVHSTDVEMINFYRELVEVDPENFQQDLRLQVFADKGSGYNETDSLFQQYGRNRVLTLRFARIEKLYSTASHPLRIDPVGIPAVLQIFSIRIVRNTSRAVLYAAETREEFERFNFSDGLLSRLCGSGLFLISQGPDPQIYLPLFGPLGEEACTLEITLRVHSTDRGMISLYATSIGDELPKHHRI